MYQLDEKLMADNRAIVAIAKSKSTIEPELKPGMVVFEHENKDGFIVQSRQVYNRIIAEDGLTGKIPYNLNFAGTITIDKDLIVKGGLTNLETQDLVVKDNIIELNKEEIGDGISRIASGIEINRGSRERARMLYSESSDRTGLGGFVFGIGNAKSLVWMYEDGDVKFLKDLYAKNATFDGNLSLSGDLIAGGNTHIKGTLTVDLATSLKSTLTVANRTAIGGSLSVGGATSLKSSLSVDGLTTLNNDVITKGLGLFEQTLTVNGNTTLNSMLNVKGGTHLEDILNVTGVASFDSNILAKSNVSVDGNLTVKGNGLFESSVSISKNIGVNGTATIQGQLTTTVIKNSKDITTATLGVTGNTTIGGSLSVTGATNFSDNVTLAKDLTVNGTALIQKELTVNSATTLDSLTVENNALIKKSLTAMLGSSFESTLSVKGDASFESNVIISKDLSVAGASNFIKEANFTTVGISQALTVYGSALFKGNSTFDERVFINAATEAKTLLLDNISFRESVGTGLKWTLGGMAQEIYGATSAAGQLYSNTDYNVYFKLKQTGSSYKGLVILNDTDPLLHITPEGVRSKNNIQVKRGNAYSNLLAESDQHNSAHAIGGHDFISPASIGAVKNTRNTPELLTDTEDQAPAAGVPGRLFFAKDTKRILQDLGSKWQIIGGQDTMDWGQITGKPETYTPPIASDVTLGGVKIGRNILIDPDGTIHVPKQTIEYTVHVEEFITTGSQKRFKLGKSFLRERNHVSPYLFGRRLPPTSFEEVSDTEIEFKEALPDGAHVCFHVLLIPIDLSFVMKLEEYIVKPNQTEFVLTQGKYTVGSNKLKLYFNGALIPRSAYDEVDASTIRLKQCPGQGGHVLIEYMYDPLA